MKRLQISCLLLLSVTFIKAQETEEKKDFGIKFSGFVKNDFIFDSRQTVAAREGHFLLYPTNEKLDEEGKDINAKPNVNFLAIQTRLKGTITGPDAFGAKTSGIIEGAFFGHSNSDVNGFRLRHAFLKLKWEKTELLIGQFWHMMFVTKCYPATVSFNTGAPFQYFTRNPQIRISQHINSFTFSGALITQRDFTSPGGSQTLRNAVLPDIQAQITYTSNEMLFAGIGAGYKQVVPRLETDSLYKTTEAVGGLTAQAFAKISTSPITFKIQGTYTQNGYDGLFIGGYAIKSITDPIRDYRNYTTINTMSLWSDIHTNGKKIQFGVFVGYTQNLGSTEEIEALTSIDKYARGYSITKKVTEDLSVVGNDVVTTKETTITKQEYITNVYRVSPRIIFNSGKTRFALEIEHTGAAYGNAVDNKGIPQNTKMIINNRILLGVYYFF